MPALVERPVKRFCLVSFSPLDRPSNVCSKLEHFFISARMGIDYS